jgi:hypothetical protein
MNLLNGKKINTWVFWPPFILFFAAALFSLTSYDKFTTTVTNAFYWTTDNFGWGFAFFSFAFLVLCGVIFFSKAGNIKFGGEDAKPEFKMWTWFAISLCAGIGTGIVFWALQSLSCTLPIRRNPWALQRLAPRQRCFPFPQCSCIGRLHLMHYISFVQFPLDWLITIISNRIWLVPGFISS